MATRGCVKRLAETPGLNSIPPSYAYYSTPRSQTDVVSDHGGSVPVVDFSLLLSDDPAERTRAIQGLGIACRDWGFFMVVNHGIPETLTKAVVDGCEGFFNMEDEEKRKYEGKHVLDPIRYGTSFNVALEKVHYWRDFLKVLVYPRFHFPDKPAGFSEVSKEYVKRIREITKGLLRGISVSLGLEECYIEKAMKVQQIFVANLYPPCPQPEYTMGLPPHSDHGLLTVLIQNHIPGLQILHNDKWFNVDPLPNSLIVNTSDQLEMISNGRYKSVLHRAVLNKEETRISIAVANGPSFETVVSPAPKLVDAGDGRPPAFAPTKYGDYVERQQKLTLNKKSALDAVRIK